MSLSEQTPVRFRDDDGTVRLARVIGGRAGRVIVLVTRDVGMTHVLSRPSDRVLGLVDRRREPWPD